MSLYSVSVLDRKAAQHVSVSTYDVQTSEEEDVGEARSGQERGACIVAGPLLGLSQKRGRPGHIGTAYQTDLDVEGPGQRARPASSMILCLLLNFQITNSKSFSSHNTLIYFTAFILFVYCIIN